VSFRFGGSKSATQGVRPAAYLVRVTTLLVMCGCAIILLRAPRSHELGQTTADREAKDSTETAIAASPFDALGAGVIVSSGVVQTPNPNAAGQPPAIATSPDGPPAVDRDLLTSVIDKTGVDRDARAYYHLVTVANRAAPTVLERHARMTPFGLLWDAPQDHRGELLFLKGYVRGLTAMTAARDNELNPDRIATLYQGYLFTDDSRPNFYVVIVPSVAPGMPTGADITETVSFAGYFLKLYRYQSADRSIRAAPLLIGRMVSWTPAPTSDRAFRLGSYLAGGVVCVVVLLGSVMWWINRRPPIDAVNSEVISADQTRANLAQLEQIDSTADSPETRNPDR